MFGRRKKEGSAPAADPEELYTRSRALTARDLPDKTRLLAQAADAGHKVAAFDLGVLLEKNHDPVGARRRYEQAAELGHQLAEKFLAALSEKERQRTERQRELDELRRAAEAGEPAAIRNYAAQLSRDHDPSANEWWERAVQAGDRLAIRHVAWDLARYTSDDIKIARARRLLLAEAAHGDVEGVQALGDFLADHDPDSAVEVWERLHSMGVGRAAYELASVYRRRRDAAEAERWFRVAIDADEDWTDEAAADFGCLLLEQGRRQEAEPLLRRSWNGDLHLAWLLESRGDDDEALEVYGRLVEQDDDQSAAKAGLARIHRRRGDRDEAAFWWEQAEEAGAEPELPPFAR